MSDRNRLVRPPDKQVQRLVIDTVVRNWPAKKSLQYVNRYLRQEGKRELKNVRSLSRIKQYMKAHEMDRLFEIAKEGFVAQHLDRIDDLIAIKKEMWECYYGLKRYDHFKAAQVLAWLTAIQPYLSQYYEASKDIMQKVSEDIKEKENGNEQNQPTATTQSDYIPISEE